ncbi:hypothetical protein Cri9333_3282 [Crinalium epipsammum PCC 9333]|uniref:Uncharacterized protein n=1 Tax=Crinalium epipsammum PCC 9333 TaxID=1173022 RepID=K9W179_9CYAN|nr:hypothetical protein [Crinalium epipsammum]AFZ14113.1 hypothetical protein Cri9333_3282 [Crinalium epipsammum PCC 9333]
MGTKSISTIVVILAVVFVSVGDRFLPKPLNTASVESRASLNNFVVGLFPAWKPKTKPYERTQKALDKVEKNPQEEKK